MDSKISFTKFLNAIFVLYMNITTPINIFLESFITDGPIFLENLTLSCLFLLMLTKTSVVSVYFLAVPSCSLNNRQ